MSKEGWMGAGTWTRNKDNSWTWDAIYAGEESELGSASKDIPFYDTVSCDNISWSGTSEWEYSERNNRWTWTAIFTSKSTAPSEPVTIPEVAPRSKAIRGWQRYLVDELIRELEANNG